MSGSRAAHDMGQIRSHSFSVLSWCGLPFPLADRFSECGGGHGHSQYLLYIFLASWLSGNEPSLLVSVGTILEKASDWSTWVSPILEWAGEWVL